MAIIRPFSSNRRLARFWDKLEILLHDACAMELARDPSLHEGSLFVRLRDRFVLDPITLFRVDGITIKPVPDGRGGGDGLPYVVSARVPYTGSKELLQTPPESGFRLAFRAKETRTALLLIDHLPDHDARAFASAVDAELARVRPLLHAFEATVRQYDEWLRKRIEAKITTF